MRAKRGAGRPAQPGSAHVSRRDTVRLATAGGLGLITTLGSCSLPSAQQGSTPAAVPTTPTARAGRSASAQTSAARSRVVLPHLELAGPAAAARSAGLRPELHQAAQVVATTWGSEVWTGAHLRCELPDTEAGFTAASGQSSAAVAAHTTATGRLVLNPQLWSRTDQRGRAVVLAHELTHLALEQYAWPAVPLWVREGSAEVTAYRPTRLRPSQVAERARRRARSGQFAPPSDHQVRQDPATGYALSYAWALYLVNHASWARYTAWVRRCARVGVDRATRESYGSTLPALESGCRAFVLGWD